MGTATIKRLYTNEMIGALCDEFGKDFLTIKRWIANDDDRLTSDRAKKVLAKFKK